MRKLLRKCVLDKMGSIYNHEIIWKPVVRVLLEATWCVVLQKHEDLCADVQFLAFQSESRPKDLSVHPQLVGLHG